MAIFLKKILYRRAAALSILMTEVEKNKRFAETGYSLIELLIVVVIIGILSALALTSFGSQKVQLQRQDAARQLKSYLERARFDSIKRRAASPLEMAKITIDSANSYVLARDSNDNGTLEASETFPVRLSPSNDVKIVGNFTTFPVTVRFNSRGQVTATDGSNSPINPIFTVCDSNCTLVTANVGNSNLITVSPSGTISLLNGGKTPPTAVQANVSNVSVGQKIDQGGTVSD